MTINSKKNKAAKAGKSGKATSATSATSATKATNESTPQLPDNSNIDYCGVDLSKATFDAFMLNQRTKIENTYTHLDGFHQWLTNHKRPHSTLHIIMEATGGHEKLLALYLQSQDIPYTIIEPARARAFATAEGIHAKTDRIDAKLLADFGRKMHPTPSTSQEHAELADMLQRHRQLIHFRTMDINRQQGPQTDTVSSTSVKETLAFFDEQLAKVNSSIATYIANDTLLTQKIEKLQETTGVGSKTAQTLVVNLPELGTVDRQAIGRLAGLAPMNRDSGTHQGKRYIQGGRAEARSALYMAALSASRYNTVLKEYYKNLLMRGKAKKVALIAVAHKLLTHLNSVMHDFLQKNSKILAPSA